VARSSTATEKTDFRGRIVAGDGPRAKMFRQSLLEFAKRLILLLRPSVCGTVCFHEACSFGLLADTFRECVTRRERKYSIRRTKPLFPSKHLKDERFSRRAPTAWAALGISPISCSRKRLIAAVVSANECRTNSIAGPLDLGATTKSEFCRTPAKCCSAST